jgi:diguanylate cyclase (GGDEF)-like protein
MSRIRSQSDADSQHVSVRRRAPLNSVSTRIILCVFVSTLLTAVIVSWLSIGAIHSDVRSRVSARTSGIVNNQAQKIEAWHAAASATLAASAAPGTAWHARLIDALVRSEKNGSTSLEWTSPDLFDPGMRAAEHPKNTLPAPPPELAEQFDRFVLRANATDAAPAADCLSSRIDLVQAETHRVASLEGCLSRSKLVGLLHPTSEDVRGIRMLVSGAGGYVASAAGVRAETRVGARLPMASLLYPRDGSLADYMDPAGVPMVGAIASLGRSGWYLTGEIEHARAFAPAIAITNQIFIVDVCIILLFSVLAYKITVAIMQPIEALSLGAQRISSGHVDYQIPLPANNDDELGLLTRTFNDMMSKLRSNQLEIEQDRFRLAEKNEELQRANEILSQLSITDGLTKLHNHRYFQDHLSREIKRVSRTKAPLSLILLDIDDFKLLNDTHGHAAGDEVLMSLAAIMNDSARESDLIARYGGEEFVILMPNTDLAGAVHLAEKIRMAVEETRLIIGDSMKPIEITISLGVALFDGHRREFFAEADRALYQAKAAGKNCVIIAGSDPTPAD